VSDDHTLLISPAGIWRRI